MADHRQTSIPMHARPDLLSPSELLELVHMIDFAKANRSLHEQLYQLHAKGPVLDGDVISKSQRTELVDAGACAKIVMKGQEGFNACTYYGRALLRIYDWLHGPLADVEALK